jgi:hypothetical protein
VVHETIDGEAILIHLRTGTYYSLDGAAAEIWALLVDGMPDTEVVARLQRSYETEEALLAESVSALVEELLQEGLLIQAPDDFAPVALAAEGPKADGPFVAPVLHKYTDMQEFMLVDPIHDVDLDVGWPHVKAG